MNYYKKRIMRLVFLIVMTYGCSGGYDESSGVYSGSNISVTFPAGWKKVKTLPNALISLKSGDKTAQLSLFTQEIPDTMTYEQYIKHVAANQKRLVGAREVDSGTIEIEGQQCIWSIKTISSRNTSFKSITYFVMNENEVFSLMGSSNLKDYAEWEATFDEVAESITFH